MRVTPIAAGLIAVVLLGSCGDDDTEETAPPSTEQETTVSPSTSEPPPPSTLPGASTSAPSTPATEPSTTGPPATEPSTTEPPTTAATTAPGGPSLPASVQDRVDAAIADLAGRQGLDAAAILVVDAREVTWPDSSLGCPQPGMSYLQVLTSGFLLVLDADGRQFEYHGSTSGDLVLCDNPRPPVQGGAGSA